MAALTPDVRSRFAQRLKALRLQRGFDRARFFAKTLGIEENRYTRYERAEVEPSLTLIQKMCDTLRVTPNDLLGFAEAGGNHPLLPARGPTDTASLATHKHDALAGSTRPDPAHALAWRLASETVAIRREHSGTAPAADPLETFREAGRLFAQLQATPFGAVAEIVGDPSLKTAAAEKKAALAELIRCYTQTLTSLAAGPQSA